MKTTTIALFCSLALLAGLTSAGAATISILNGDGANEGFNDTTPVAPVPGNPGTTLGQQRLNLFQAAADRWAAMLVSDVEIVVLARFDSLTCNALRFSVRRVRRIMR